MDCKLFNLCFFMHDSDKICETLAEIAYVYLSIENDVFKSNIF